MEALVELFFDCKPEGLSSDAVGSLEGEERTELTESVNDLDVWSISAIREGICCMSNGDTVGNELSLVSVTASAKGKKVGSACVVLRLVLRLKRVLMDLC